MNTADLAKLLYQIKTGAVTPDQMEDIVYAIHAAYIDHNESIYQQMTTVLECVADEMVQARRTIEQQEECAE